MRINKYLFSLAIFFTSIISISYARWQFNNEDNLVNDKGLSITNGWRLNISMNDNGEVFDGDNHFGHIVYETDNTLAGGSITSNFVYNENNDLSVNTYLASELGSDIKLFSSTDVYLSLPKAIHVDETNEDIPVVGIDHLGTYTTIGGPLHRRYVYVTIPSGYTFIGNYAFYLTGSDHADSNIEYNIPKSVTYIGHEAFNFSTLNHMKDMWDQKYKFRVNYEGTAEEFLTLINNSKELYEKNYVGIKKNEMEAKAKTFQNEIDNTGGIIYSGSTSYSWFFRPSGQEKSTSNTSYWPAQTDYIDVYCATNPVTNKKEIVRFYASSPIAEECISKISHYKKTEPISKDPIIIEIDE